MLTALGLSLSVPEAVGYIAAAVVTATFAVSVVVSAYRQTAEEAYAVVVEPRMTGPSSDEA